MISLRLNADLGEGLDEVDRKVMPFIDQANIACGGHAGDASSIESTATLAHKHGVAIGAHPSYIDPSHFGRRSIRVESSKLEQQIFEQVQRIADICDSLGTSLRHVKAHGALYNDCVGDDSKQLVLMRVAKAFNCVLLLQCLPNMHATIKQANTMGLRLEMEGFADRAYQPDGLLVPRSNDNAVHSSLEKIVAQGLAFSRQQAITCVDGRSTLSLKLDSLCVHGDTDLALQAIKALHDALH